MSSRKDVEEIVVDDTECDGEPTHVVADHASHNPSGWKPTSKGGLRHLENDGRGLSGIVIPLPPDWKDGFSYGGITVRIED